MLSVKELPRKRAWYKAAKDVGGSLPTIQKDYLVLMAYRFKRRSDRGYIEVHTPIGLIYHVNADGCSCPDWHYRRAGTFTTCKHMRAVYLAYGYRGRDA